MFVHVLCIRIVIQILSASPFSALESRSVLSGMLRRLGSGVIGQSALSSLSPSTRATMFLVLFSLSLFLHHGISRFLHSQQSHQVAKIPVGSCDMLQPGDQFVVMDDGGHVVCTHDVASDHIISVPGVRLQHFLLI